MKTKKQKKGVSLIVLVITIIIMIILASAVVISLNRSGMKAKSKDAVEKFDDKQLQELISLAWADAYAENVGKSNEELLQALKTSVENALSENNLNKEDYGIYVTEKGVEIIKGTGWVQTSDRHVIKQDTVLEIGDYVNYISGVEDYTDKKGWRVLGAENGELLLMSTKDVASIHVYDDYYGLETAQETYNNRISKLNEICAPYGKGAYAIGARSITVEDVDRVTGYDKTTYERIYENDYKIKYGDSITYYWDNTSGKESYPYYEITRGTTKLTGNLKYEQSLFIYHNGKEWVTSAKPSNLTDKQEICTLTQTGYFYDVDQETNLTSETKAYIMLFERGDYADYWLASTGVSCIPYYNCEFGFFGIYNRTSISLWLC